MHNIDKPSPSARPIDAAASRPPATAYAMQTGYGKWLKPLFHRLFARLHYPEQNAKRLRSLAGEAVLIYIARGRGDWLALCFSHLLERAGLPLASFVGGANLLLWQPLHRLWAAWHRQARVQVNAWRALSGATTATPREAILATTALAGCAALIVLPPRRATVGPLVKTGRDDFLRTLIAAQRLSDRPFLLLPHVLVHRNLSGSTDKTLTDRIFGERRRPGRLRQMALLFSTLRSSSVRMAEPLNLRTLAAQHPDVDDLRLARKVAYELNRRMDEEERVIAGGHLADYPTTARHVLRHPGVKQALAERAGLQRKGATDLNAQAAHHLRQIAARYDVRFINVLSTVLGWVFSRIYDGIAVDREGLDRVIDAARHGPLIFCPSHRSHVDYLVLSHVLWQHGVAPPHIAAGANLSFFPLGAIFRRCGAFFLRRTFRDDPLYAAVFRAYVNELVQSGASLEFFLEGMRSRTGKHLMPKFGILSMIVEAWRRGKHADIQFVPVSIDYERIIEAKAYEQELSGNDKKPEDISGLLRTTKVLRSRYGRVQVQFGEPVSLTAFAEQHHLNQHTSVDARSDEAWRKLTERLGYQVMHRVATVSSVTPTAVVCTALLSHHARGLAVGKLVERCNAIMQYLESENARPSHAFQHQESRDLAVMEAVQNLVDDGFVTVERAGSSDIEPIYRVPEKQRIVLEYHKNTIINYLAPGAILARAVLCHGNQAITLTSLSRHSQFLINILKREFIYRPAASFAAEFEAVLGSMTTQGLLMPGPEQTLLVRQPTTIALLSSLLDSYIQGYWTTLEVLKGVITSPIGRKEFINRCLERIRRAYLEGVITRPETANRTLVETALQWSLGEALVEVHPEGKRPLIKPASPASAARLDELTATLAAYF